MRSKTQEELVAPAAVASSSYVVVVVEVEAEVLRLSKEIREEDLGRSYRQRRLFKKRFFGLRFQLKFFLKKRCETMV